MKLLRNVGTTTKAILLAGLLGACQTENDSTLAPQASANVSDKNAKTAAAPLLIKDGNMVLEYTTQGRVQLWKEINPGTNKYRAYAYTATTVTGYESYIGGNSTSFPSYYYLDVNGRCEESSASGKTCKYEYDAQGRLTKCYMKNLPNERIEFGYNASGNLSTINYFDKYDNNTRELSFSYGNPTIEDKTPLNPEALWQFSGVSKYLPLFGTFSTKLVKVVGDKKLPWNGAAFGAWTYDYSFTPDGYVKTVIATKADASSSSTERKYSAPLAQ